MKDIKQVNNIKLCMVQAGDVYAKVGKTVLERFSTMEAAITWASDTLDFIQPKKPNIIKAIYDNGGESIDQITVVLNERHSADPTDKSLVCLGLSYNAVAFSQFSSCICGKHLGKKVLWKDLSNELQKHIVNRLN